MAYTLLVREAKAGIQNRNLEAVIEAWMYA